MCRTCRLNSERPLSTITRRESDVASLTAEGMKDQEIADTLGISVNTVRHHLMQLRDKTGTDNRTQLAAWWGNRI